MKRTKKTLKKFFVRLGLDVTLNKGFTVEAENERDAEEKARAAAEADPAPFSTWDFDPGMGAADCDVLNNYQATKAKCDNCGKVTDEDKLNEARDLHERVGVGGEMPAGECPACGALAYLVDE